MTKGVNTLKVDSGEKVLKQYCLTREVSASEVVSHLSLGIFSLEKQHRIVSLCIKRETVTSYVNNFSKPLNKYIVTTKIKEIKLTKAEFQQAKIYKIPNNNKTRYKINNAYTEKSILTLFIFNVENLLTGKTSINNDLIKWLPSFNWEMNIVLFYLL